MRVRTERRSGPDGDTVRLTYARPEKLNALTPEAIAELTGHFLNMADDRDLRCAVVTGSGDKSFIGGADIGTLAALGPETARTFITSLHKLFLSIRECPVPVIARINGYCLGAGMELAASCDMRIASDSARFGMPEVQVGIPSVVEAALLPRLIGRGRTAHLVLTGEMIDARIAEAWGFVEKLVADRELDTAIDQCTDAVCRAGPQAIRTQKTLLSIWDDASLDEAIARSIDLFADSYRTGEPRKAINRFLENKAR
ncbi:MAG: enoyl-CoA hydratase [Pseudomonadota bacterium]